MLVAIGWAYWLVAGWLVIRLIRSVPRLNRLEAPAPPTWRRLSIILPACNEADRIEAALRDRLREDYPNVEIIVVEDRSTDATPELVDRVTAQDSRVTVEHIRGLPDGWLGKTHAMHCGARRATGDWLLFSDADVHVEPGVMRRVIAYCESRGLDFLTVLPEMWSSAFALDAVMGTFVRSFSLVGRLWKVEDPASAVYAGVGAFNLVRRTAFERAGGFEKLRLTVVDDMGLGRLLKRTGARCAVVNGCGQVGLHFYRDFGEMLRGTEKTVYIVNNFSLPRVVASSVAFVWLECAPFFGVIADLAPWVRIASAGFVLLALAQAAVMARWLHRPLWPTLCIPVGVILSAYAGIRSGILAVRRGGVLWRGTLYPNALLRQHEQVTLP